MDMLSGASVVERGIFDPRHANEAAIFAAWAASVAVIYWRLAAKHQSGPKEWALLMLGVLMPSYALRYVFFGTRWGSNSSFAMVNLTFTPLCPARILLPCPDSDPLNCRLNYPKMSPRAADLTPFSAIPNLPEISVSSSNSSQHTCSSMTAGPSAQNVATKRLGLEAASCTPPLQCVLPHQSNTSQGLDTHARANAPVIFETTEQQGRSTQQGLHFPVLVPLWQIYVRERPLPIYLHTTFMTVAALLWPLQMWKAFRQHHYALHRRLGYLALAATALGSLSAAPYALSYLLSARLPETITGFGYLGMYSCAACFLVKGIKHGRSKRVSQHQLNMVRLVGLSWGVSPLGRILTVTPPIIWFSGPWNNAAVVCLSWPLGIWLAQHYLLGDAATVH